MAISKRLFLLALFLGICCTQAEAGALEQIPPQDRGFLTDFFKGLLTQGHFAATLFGQKPASSFDYPPQYTLYAASDPCKARFLLESKGWRTWQKYRHLFPIKNYLFLTLEREFLSVLFVHKDEMLNTLHKHRSFFKTHFSTDPLEEDLEIFLRRALAPNFHLPNFHLAQGLLLGYEKKSCLAFQEKGHIEETLAYFPYDTPDVPTADVATPPTLLNGHPKNLFQRLKQFKSRFTLKKTWPDSNPLFCTSPPQHMAFGISFDPGTVEVQKKIIALYNSDHFLEDLIKILSE